MSITLRDIRPEDEAFLLEVYASTRAYEMSLVPWTDEQKDAFVRMQFIAQSEHYHERWPDADYKVIVKDGKAVGRIYVSREPEGIRVMDITVLPEHRNAGIGTTLLAAVLAEAEQSARSVQIYVDTLSSSLGLFQNLGFAVVEQHFPSLLLEWRPRSLVSEPTSPLDKEIRP